MHCEIYIDRFCRWHTQECTQDIQKIDESKLLHKKMCEKAKSKEHARWHKDASLKLNSIHCRVDGLSSSSSYGRLSHWWLNEFIWESFLCTPLRINKIPKWLLRRAKINAFTSFERPKINCTNRMLLSDMHSHRTQRQHGPQATVTPTLVMNLCSTIYISM